MVRTWEQVDSAGPSESANTTIKFFIPREVRAGMLFTASVSIAVRHFDYMEDFSDQQFAAGLSLTDEEGNPSNVTLTGPLTSSMCSGRSSTDKHADFSPLAIASPGKYRFKVTILRSMPTSAAIVAHGISHIIYVSHPAQ